MGRMPTSTKKPWPWLDKNTDTSCSSSITGSAPYWWARKKDVDRLVQEQLFYDNQLPILFHTGSMAEYHWPDLHQLLYQALNSWGRNDKALVVKRAMYGDDSE